MEAMKKKTKWLLYACAFLLLFSVFFLGPILWSYRDTTVYAESYSEEEFSKLKLGMTKSAVMASLGKPLEVRTQESNERWYYNDVKIQRSGLFGRKVNVSGMLGPEISVDFDEGDRVSRFSGEHLEEKGLRKGLDKNEVNAALGPPLRRRPAYQEIFYYTDIGGEGLFKGRAVVFDSEGKIIEVVQYQFYD